MSLLSDKTKDIVKGAVIKKIIGGIAVLFMGGFYYPIKKLIEGAVPAMDKSILAHILTIETLSVIGISLLALFFYMSLRNEKKKQEEKDPLKEYDFDKTTGILTNKDNGYQYCPSCFQKNTKSLLREQDNGWQCLNKDCKEFYYKEGHSAYDGTKGFLRSGMDLTGFRV